MGTSGPGIEVAVAAHVELLRLSPSDRLRMTARSLDEEGGVEGDGFAVRVGKNELLGAGRESGSGQGEGVHVLKGD